MSKRSTDELILGCKTVGCPWDPYPPVYVANDRLGRRHWEARIRCMNCGSVKVEKYKPDGSMERIGQPRYFRTPGWYDPELRVYWGKARAERMRRGMIKLTSPEA